MTVPSSVSTSPFDRIRLGSRKSRGLAAIISALAAVLTLWVAGRASMNRMSPEVTAFSIAAEYGVFSRPVIAQRVFLRNQDMTVVFWEDWGFREELEADGPGSEHERGNWDITVRFFRDRTKPRVETERMEGVARAPRDVALGKAVVAACMRLEEERGTLPLPATISAQHTEDGYSVMFTGLPQVPGDNVTVDLSKDLKCCSVVPGV